jgi:hypothetical protein
MTSKKAGLHTTARGRRKEETMPDRCPPYAISGLFRRQGFGSGKVGEGWHGYTSGVVMVAARVTPGRRGGDMEMPLKAFQNGACLLIRTL